MQQFTLYELLKLSHVVLVVVCNLQVADGGICPRKIPGRPSSPSHLVWIQHKGFVPVWSMNRYRKVSLQRRQAGRRIRKQNKPRKWEGLCRTGHVTFKTLTLLNERTWISSQRVLSSHSELFLIRGFWLLNVKKLMCAQCESWSISFQARGRLVFSFRGLMF